MGMHHFYNNSNYKNLYVQPEIISSYYIASHSESAHTKCKSIVFIIIKLWTTHMYAYFINTNCKMHVCMTMTIIIHVLT